MVHAFPVSGCVDHGFYNHQPCLLNALAAVNAYTVLASLMCEDGKDKIIHLAWQKTGNGGFKVPQQRSESAGVMGGSFIPVPPETRAG